MFKTVKGVFDRALAALKRGAKSIVGRIKAFHLTRDQWRRIGAYAALAALLVILGAASSAYRAKRQAAPVEEPPARTVLSARAEPLLPTPEPTPEPIVWVWPLEGEIVGAYSPDEPVWSKTLEQWQTHAALDIAGSPGEVVYACRDGVVADAWCDRVWGNVIAIDHADGYRSVYAGLNTLKLVEVGVEVKAGDVISAVGPSLPCEADLPAHIHFELTQDGAPVDFEAMMKAE